MDSGKVDALRRLVSAILVIGPALFFGWRRDATLMGLAIIAGALAAAYLNIDRIQRFRGGGFEAEMKKATNELYATTSALRDAARPLIGATLHILTMAGRWGGMSSTAKHEFRNEIEELQGKLQLSDDPMLRKAHEDFFRMHTWDHFSRFADSVVRANGSLVAGEQLRQLQDRSSTMFPTEDGIRTLLAAASRELADTEEELLQDYLHYLHSRSLRRPEAIQPE